MKKIILFILLAFSPFFILAQEDVRKIIVGDTVQILVIGEPDLSMSIQLNESGVFNYPFLGEIKLRGKTIFEVQEMITVGLKGDYLIDPKVNVNVTPLEEEQAIEQLEGIYVNGEVVRNGQFPYAKGLTVGKAIVLAGGFTERAAKTKIKILSGKAGDKEVRVGLDYVLKPGDIITIPRRFF